MLTALGSEEARALSPAARVLRHSNFFQPRFTSCSSGVFLVALSQLWIVHFWLAPQAILAFAVVYRAQLGGSGVALKLAKGCGHNRYGEPAWLAERLSKPIAPATGQLWVCNVFPVVIAGVSAACQPIPSMGVASAEPCRALFGANSFVTPIDIVPEWYFLPSFNVLRLLGDKPVGVGTLVTFLLRAPLAPFMENPVAYQNPFRRFAAVSSFSYLSGHLPVATIGAGASIHAAFPFH